MPATLTAEELAAMQETAEENLPDVCRVISVSFVKDVRGNPLEQEDVGPPFACRVKPLAQATVGSREALIAERLGVLESWKIRAPKTIAVQLRDRIRVTIEGVSRDMEIVGAPNLRSRQTIDTFYATEFKS